MEISLSEVEHIARLARLRLNDDEKTVYSLQLSDILSYIEKLNEIDISDVEPTSHIFPLKNVFRDDELKESLRLEDALRNAPQTSGPYYKVPRIIE